jgi:hypothetical protein
MIITDHFIHQDSEPLSGRAQARAFFGRADVIAKLQASGIRDEEALSWVDSLTDREIASLAGKMDQIPAGAQGSYEFDGSIAAIIGVLIYAIFMAIAIYFSRTTENTEKPQHKESSLNSQLPDHPSSLNPGVQ